MALAVFSGMGGPRPEAMVFFGVVGVALLALGMALDQAILVTGGMLVLAGQFILSLYVRETSPSSGDSSPWQGALGLGGEPAGFTAALYGSALLLVAELAFWSLQLGVRQRGGGRVLRRRGAAITALVAASLAMGLVVAAMAQATLPGSIALTAAGIGAVLAVMVLVGMLLWDRREG